MKKLEKHIIQELKIAILQSRYQAARLVNKELIVLYFKIGKKISANTKKMAWGSKVLEQISLDLQNELPGLRGFSATNLKRMTSFSEFWMEYLSISPTLSDQLENDESSIRPTLSDEFAQAFFSVSFSHHYLIASKTETIEEAQFYIYKILSELWSYRTLQHQIESRLYQQQGALPNNFEQILPKSSSNKAMQMFKDEYLLDFINIEAPDEEDERLIEREIVRNIKKFILALGTNFAFMGNQYRLIIEEQEYFVDLLFYNRKLQCLVAFELKKGKFKPEYLGKMNFYLSALDDTIKQPHENSSVGIVLCKEKNNKVVEYSFRDFSKAMGVATYKTSKEIPEKYKNALPDAETLKKIMS
ncbi:MAG TPA: PDDEXK nuclease domain-containing protein [Salinimicrobium sp.]|nr:PDDEXK nuclease domain-containing protein [Salinimicrobium sp.]